MNEIFFDPTDDAQELLKALRAEGYDVTVHEADNGPWSVTVQPFDDGVIAMVDVYGGWLPGDEQRPTL